MALFGKKKKAEQTAAPVEEQDEILVVGGDADELATDDDSGGGGGGGGGQVIDFDAIADELGDDSGESIMIEPSGAGAAPAATPPDDFATTADFESGNAGINADDDLDFDSVFDEGTSAATVPVATSQTDENPFGAETVAAMPASGPIAIEPVSHTSQMTHTAPLLTSDAVATAGVPRARRSFPLPMLLGAIGLLIALGTVGYLVTRGNSTPDEEPVVATNPPLRAPAGSASLVNLGASVDGVPIAPGAFRSGAPALIGPRPTVPLTPALLKQLKDLWAKGAAAKKKGDIAGARAAWTKMLRLRPNHPGVKSAIDKLPAA